MDNIMSKSASTGTALPKHEIKISAETSTIFCKFFSIFNDRYPNYKNILTRHGRIRVNEHVKHKVCLVWVRSDEYLLSKI